MEPNTCPHCGLVLSDQQVTTAYKRMIAGKRKKPSGGRNGGRRGDYITFAPAARAPIFRDGEHYAPVPVRVHELRYEPVELDEMYLKPAVEACERRFSDEQERAFKCPTEA